MRYLLLIYATEQPRGTNPPDQEAAYMDAWFKYTDDFGKSGKMKGGEALQPTATATTVRAESGKPRVSDGPFAETKEQLGGYFVIDAANIDEAIEWASRMPHMPYGGSVEIRPIMEMPRG